MRVLVVYDSTHGNTELIARAIVEGLSQRNAVRLKQVAATRPSDVVGIDLLIAGAPTQRHRSSDAMGMFLESLPRRSLNGVLAAAFDTRYRMSRWLSGSAAVDIARGLKHAGATLIDEPQSFFMEMDHPPKGEKRRHDREQLESGEIERARAWGASLLAPALREVGLRANKGSRTQISEGQAVRSPESSAASGAAAPRLNLRS